MNREYTIDYPLGGSKTVTIGQLYSVHGWNKNAFFRLISVDSELKSAKIATVKQGKIHDVWVSQLIPYTPKKKRNIHWRYSGQQRF